MRPGVAAMSLTCLGQTLMEKIEGLLAAILQPPDRPTLSTICKSLLSCPLGPKKSYLCITVSCLSFWNTSASYRAFSRGRGTLSPLVITDF